jgi:anti-anti-sigma regulatory factor
VQAFLGAATSEAWRAERPPLPSAQVLYDDGVLSLRAGSDGSLRVAGDLDAANIQVFTAELEHLAAAGADVRVDMSAVLFADLGALRALVKTAQSLTDGRLVEIVGMPCHLVKVMEVVRWDELPNLVVRAAVAEPAA